MRRSIALAGYALVLGIATALALGGCAARETAIKPAVSAPAFVDYPVPAAMHRPVAAIVLADSARNGDPVPRPRTVWIVSLDGRVTKRTVPPASNGDTTFPLSPDGRALLYADGAPWRARYARHIRELDLDTGKDTVVITGRPVAWGWDSSGRIVAVTASSVSWNALGQQDLRGLTLWRGEPGRLTTASLPATWSSEVPSSKMTIRRAPPVVPVDITTFIGADDGAAYFGGSTQTGFRGPSVQHVWRYDFATRRLGLLFSQPGMRVGLGSRPGDAGSSLVFRHGPTQDALTTGLRADHRTTVRVETVN